MTRGCPPCTAAGRAHARPRAPAPGGHSQRPTRVRPVRRAHTTARPRRTRYVQPRTRGVVQRARHPARPRSRRRARGRRAPCAPRTARLAPTARPRARTSVAARRLGPLHARVHTRPCTALTWKNKARAGCGAREGRASTGHAAHAGGTATTRARCTGAPGPAVRPAPAERLGRAHPPAVPNAEGARPRRAGSRKGRTQQGAPPVTRPSVRLRSVTPRAWAHAASSRPPGPSPPPGARAPGTPRGAAARVRRPPADGDCAESGTGRAVRDRRP